ncbi:AMP-binding protein [Lutimaribacter marinistellae]|uniref:AMP-binding protein n=1 Tax=Lutimaribacter marinistellae TaxID=1820329 RepID=A0ABV7TCY9_9RHOB
MTGAATLAPGLPALIDGAPAARAAEALAARSATLYEAFAQAATVHPDNAFLCILARAGRAYCPDGAEFTYGQALEEVETRAALYRAAGYGPGHRVALMLDNRPEHLFNQLALYAVGATQVPVNPDYLDHELEYLLEHSEADLALGHAGNIDQLNRVGSALGVPVLEEAALRGLPRVSGARDEVPGRTTEAALIYTSGTTGRPKGCVIDHEYHFAVGLGYARHGGRLALLHGGDRLFVPLPVFHVNAGINTLTALILTGNCLILPDRFHPDSWWQDIAATRATAMHYLGIIPPILMKRPPSAQDRAHGLRFGLGAGLDPDLHAAFEDRFGVAMVEVWGMTETGRFLADCHEPRRIDTRAFGKPYDDLEAQVWDEAGREVPYGTEGELVVRAPGDDPRRGFFREYLKNPEATAEVWQGGWFHTGDVVRQEPDGMVHFVERRKNIIRRSGENISAAEVENALIGHPSVGAVAVISVTDEMRDEEVMACIVPAEGAAPDETTARAVFEHGRALVAYYKLPGWVAFVDDLPRTGTQKVRKGLIFPGLDDPRDAPGIVDLRALKKRSKP